jgi:hypothetical protein
MIACLDCDSPANPLDLYCLPCMADAAARWTQAITATGRQGLAADRRPGPGWLIPGGPPIGKWGRYLMAESRSRNQGLRRHGNQWVCTACDVPGADPYDAYCRWCGAPLAVNGEPPWNDLTANSSHDPGGSPAVHEEPGGRQPVSSSGRDPEVYPGTLEGRRKWREAQLAEGAVDFDAGRPDDGTVLPGGELSASLSRADERVEQCAKVVKFWHDRVDDAWRAAPGTAEYAARFKAEASLRQAQAAATAAQRHLDVLLREDAQEMAFAHREEPRKWPADWCTDDGANLVNVSDPAVRGQIASHIVGSLAWSERQSELNAGRGRGDSPTLRDEQGRFVSGAPARGWTPGEDSHGR